MQQHSLLATKHYIPPVRPELVSRPRLIERLNAGPNRKLTLVSAPAGSGKTTLVTQWLRSAQCPSAWLSLDGSENGATGFLAYFIAALQIIEADVGKGALSTLQSPQPPSAESILTLLSSDVVPLPNCILLVLDHYHRIEAHPIHDALTFSTRVPATTSAPGHRHPRGSAPDPSPCQGPID